MNLADSRSLVEALLTRLASGMFGGTSNAECALGAALEAAYKVISPIGGKVLAFLSSMPTIGPGMLKAREDVKQYETENEKNMLVPAHLHYRDLALRFSNDQVSVDLFVTSHTYVDLATVSTISKYTGAQVYFYPGFSRAATVSLAAGANLSPYGAVAAGHKGVQMRLRQDLLRVLTRYTGFEAVMRIRTSQGINVNAFYGNFFIRGKDLLALPNVDSDKAHAVTFAHTGNVLNSPTVFIQAAVLYTTSSGERRIRSHTLTLPVTSSLSDLFKYSDVDATMNLLARMSIDSAVSCRSMATARDQVIDRIIRILRCYRMSVSTSGPSSHNLILPDSLRLIPLYILGLLKSPVLNANTRADERTAIWQRVMTSSCAKSAVLFHPRLFDLSKWIEQNNNDDLSAQSEGPTFPLPSALVPLSFEQLDPSKVFVLDNGMSIWIWAGSNADSDFVEDCAASAEFINTLGYDNADESRLPVAQQRLLQFIRGLRNCRQPEFLDVRFVRQGSPVLEDDFRRLLIEDRNIKSMSYIEFLTYIHQQIASLQNAA